MNNPDNRNPPNSTWFSHIHVCTYMMNYDVDDMLKWWLCDALTKQSWLVCFKMWSQSEFIIAIFLQFLRSLEILQFTEWKNSFCLILKVNFVIWGKCIDVDQSGRIKPIIPKVTVPKVGHISTNLDFHMVMIISYW